MRSGQFIWCILLLIGLLITAGGAEPTPAVEKLKAVAPGGEVEALDPAKYRVIRWIEDPQARHADLKWRQQPVEPAEVAGVYRVGQQFFVKIEAPATQASGEHPASQWLTGWVASGNEINCSPQAYATLDALLNQVSYAKLPAMPGDWHVREVARMPSPPVRLASDGTGNTLWVLGQNGDLSRVDIATGDLTQVLRHDEYLPDGGDALGMAFDAAQQRLYIVTNQHDDKAQPEQNRVTIFRTATVHNGLPAQPEPWLRTSYPYGVNTFNHGVSSIAFGPDGMLYVNSGSRTDHGELGSEPNIARIPGGETPITACIWRLDPRSDNPQIEIFARGIRNAFGFCWDDRGRMLATENGPNADAPEELNLIEQGKHYGFPYQFADWEKKAYPDQPDAPPGLKGKMVPPIINEGPDGIGPSERAASTLEPHSCPAGIVFLGEEFPEEHRGTFLVARFGNFIGPRDVGFDVLQVRLGDRPDAEGRLHATVETFLAPVARPLDIHVSGGKIYLCEYSREISNTGVQLPGRILEVAMEEEAASPKPVRADRQ